MADPSNPHPHKRRRIETLTPTAKGKEKLVDDDVVTGAGDEVAASSSGGDSDGDEVCGGGDVTSSSSGGGGGGGGDEGEAVCGICLSEGGRAVRGRIDSCDHFFCFVCIMEWARIESRCPMCKGRFGSIRRQRVAGVFACERVVVVPHRDQVYHPLGNESTSLTDPYAHTSCHVCNSSANENVMLLCDLCDSAAHTYCVGLGDTVPEGDWYCPDCAISRDEHLKVLSDVDSCNQYSPLRGEPLVSSSGTVPPDNIASSSSQSLSTIQVPVEHQRVIMNNEYLPSPTTAGNTRSCTHQSGAMASAPNVSIFDIVSDVEGNGYRLPTRSTSRRISRDSMLQLEELTYHPVDENVRATRPEVDKGQRTLSRCRKVHGRIRELRENWNALRAGSTSFSSRATMGSRAVSSQKLTKRAMPSNTRGLPDSTSASSLQIASDANAPRKKHNNGDSQDVSKAWKMMQIAKSIQPTRRSTISTTANSVQVASDANASSKKHNIGGSLDVRRAWTMMQIANSVEPTRRSNTSNQCVNSCRKSASTKAGRPQSSSSISKDHKSANKVTGKCQSQSIEKPKSDPKMMEMQRLCRATGDSVLSGYSEPTYTKQNKVSLKTDEQQLLHRARVSSDKFNTQVHPGSSHCSLPEASSLSSARCIDIKCSKVEPHKWNQGECVDIDDRSSKSRNIDLKDNRTKSKDANSVGRTANSSVKEEVQSLVKLNLKLLTRERQLDTEQFKEIARASTHTILAACGFDVHSKSKTSFSSPICRHSKETKLTHKSSLMPDSCRECFYTFVKNIVDKVLLEKLKPNPS